MMYALGAAGCKPLPIFRQDKLSISMLRFSKSLAGYHGGSGGKPTKMTKVELLQDSRQKKIKAQSTGIFSRLVRRFRRDR